MPPISAVHAEEAIASAEQREGAVHDASALLNKDLTSFIDNFVLPEDPVQCPQEYGLQLAAQHTAYLQQVREEIRLQSHNLRNFHAPPRPRLSSPGGEDRLDLGNLHNLNAMSKVVTLVAAAVQHNKRMRSLHAEASRGPPLLPFSADSHSPLQFVRVHSRLEAIGALTPLDRVFIEQTLPGIVSTMEASDRDVKRLRDRLQAFKQTFYLLANQREVATCVTHLLDSQITAEEFAEQAMEPFKTLFRLARKRDKLIKKAENIAVSHAVAWLSLPNGRVPSYVYLKELERYESLLHSIEGQKQGHDSCVGVLTMLHQQANGWPQAVMGPNGHHISLTVIHCAMQEYEWITETSYQLIEAALPINKTLNAYTTELPKLFK